VESYYASEVQERSEKTGRLRKEKQIWWQPSESSTQALVYTIDQSSGKCEIGHKSPNQLIEFKFPAGSEGEEEFSMSLSAKRLAELLAEEKNYHLIDEGELFDARREIFRNKFYEYRVHEFEIITSNGSIRKEPVSLVKQISSRPYLLDRMDKDRAQVSPKNRVTLENNYHTVLTIFFFSQDYKHINYKLSLDVVGNFGIDLDYLHSLLDVTECYPTERKREITAKYPLESTNLMETCRVNQRYLRNYLYANLFFDHDSLLSPLQIAKLETSVDAFNLKTRMTVLDIPVSHGFEMKRDRTFETISMYNALQVIASSAEKCSEHCEHRNCFRFAYEPAKRICLIDLGSLGARELIRSGSELYTFVHRDGQDPQNSDKSTNELVRPHYNAESIIELFLHTSLDSTVSLPDKRDPSRVSGYLDIPVRSNYTDYLLRPTSIDHDLSSMNEFERENSADNDDNLIFGKKTGSFLLEYSPAKEGKSIKSEVAVSFNFANYDDCEQMCTEMDCRTFSFCESTEVCMISHSELGSIGKHLKDEPLSSKCAIYKLNDLSKFESYGEVVTSTKDLKAKSHSRVAITANECSTVCMQEKKFACQGFYFCQNARGCYLTDEHSGKLVWSPHSPIGFNANQRSKDNKGTTDSKDARSQTVCEYYSRSYIAQFDKYFGKKIDPGQQDGHLSSKSSLFSASSEECAKRCVENQEEGCLAFHVCPSTETKHIKQTCMMFHGEKLEEKGADTKGSKTSGSLKCRLVKEPKCTTFIMSAKSRFNPHKLKLIAGDSSKSSAKPDVEATPGSGELGFGSFRVGAPSARWFAGALSFISGLLVGCLLVLSWNEVYARGYIGRVREMIAR